MVVGPDGIGLPATTVTLNGVDHPHRRRRHLRHARASAGDVTAERPAWEPATTTWDGETEHVEVRHGAADHSRPPGQR